jgi:TolA-binding protein
MRLSRRVHWLSLCWALAPAAALAQDAAPAPQPAAAKSAQPAPSDSSAVLRAYFRAFADKHLVSTETAPVRELRQQLAAAEELGQRGMNEAAVLSLYELTTHPRFADYAELEELDAANYALGSSLHALGAEESARVALARVLKKGPDNPYFAPAFRRYVDVVLAGEPLAQGLRELSSFSGELPEDAHNELAYVQARERLAANDVAAAKVAFERITRHSRFYANAQYQLGALAAKERSFRDAEARFCRIAGAGDDDRYSFYVDARYFRIKDLARLALGRVAHEQRRGDDAFYYYFQVPNDSPRLPEAMFEAAYARYEVNDYEGASDLLDQLEARFPRSPSADEASLLRGYVALARCDFEAADEHFQKFTRRFTPVLDEIDRISKNPSRREALYEELRARQEQRTERRPSAVHASLLSLLRVDPDFNDLHERLAQLDAEAARSGRLAQSFDLLGARYEGSDRPRALAHDDVSARRELDELRAEVSDARRALRALDDQLDALRALRAPAAELASEEQKLSDLARRVRALETRIDDARVQALPAEPEASHGDDFARLLQHDSTHAAAFERRVLELRPRLVRAANQRALAELRALRERLGGFLRRARIGRIDAVMGSKRRVERQIESLAAGRLPAELRDPLLIQGFLSDDEEYWPFEGEDWPDEYIERYGDEQPRKKP